MTENNNTETLIDTVNTPNINEMTKLQPIEMAEFVNTQPQSVDANILSTEIKDYIKSLNIDIEALSAAIDAMIENRTPIKEIPKKHPNFIKMIIDFLYNLFFKPKKTKTQSIDIQEQHTDVNTAVDTNTSITQDTTQPTDIKRPINLIEDFATLEIKQPIRIDLTDKPKDY